MIEKISDLHIHSKYSRACSKRLELPVIASTCEIRGIDIVVTGDMTHPLWFDHMRETLVEDTAGVYKLKDGSSSTQFILGTEISLIKKHKDKTRRIHLCVFAPNLEVAEKLNKELAKRNFNLSSDGRPILGMVCHDFLELLLEVDERIVLIPAHAWTPWFGIFGSKGGYDSLQDAFDDLTPHIWAVETGLSSDPLMNWRCSMLDDITLVSNSDAHSPQKLGREANVFAFENEAAVTYNEIMRIIREGDRKKFLYTIEFYPEEGKYHMDGHRDCDFMCEPDETHKLKGICPKCKKPLVVGVMNRVNELADRSEEEAKKMNRIPYKSVVPLPEIIADVFQCGVATKRVHIAYEKIIAGVGNEFYVLLHADLKKITDASSPIIADAIDRVRKGNIFVKPGYDGEFGIVKVFSDSDNRGLPQQSTLNIK